MQVLRSEIHSCAIAKPHEPIRKPQVNSVFGFVLYSTKQASFPIYLEPGSVEFVCKVWIFACPVTLAPQRCQAFQNTYKIKKYSMTFLRCLGTEAICFVVLLKLNHQIYKTPTGRGDHSVAQKIHYHLKIDNLQQLYQPSNINKLAEFS